MLGERISTVPCSGPEQLAKAVVELRDAGRVDPKIAVVATFDLTGTISALLINSVAESIAVSAGLSRTPEGLITASA